MDFVYKDATGQSWPAVSNPRSVRTVDGVKIGEFAVFCPMPKMMTLRISTKARHLKDTAAKV